MGSFDLFKRKALLPAGETPKPSSERSIGNSSQEGDETVFERPTLTPDVPPEVHARRAMDALEEVERAVTARSPPFRQTTGDEGTPAAERIEPNLDHIELGLISLNPTAPRATVPGHAKREPAAGPESETQRPLDQLPLELEAELDSALDFVDTHDRDAQAPGEPGPSSAAGPGGGEESSTSLSALYAVGDFTGALDLAQERLSKEPDDEQARRYAVNCRDVLSKMYCARIGSLQQPVRVAVAPEQIRWLSIDHRAGFLLSLVDGQSTVEDLLDISGMPRLDALRIIAELVAQKVVSSGP